MIGRRVPDIELDTSDGPTRIYQRLHHANPLFVNLGLGSELDTTPWPNGMQHIDATYTGTWELPVIGEVEPPSALLVRPDGYVARAGREAATGLQTALSTWFGG